jgi:TPR repeat protein
MRRVVTVLAVLVSVPAFGADWVEVKSPAFSVLSNGGEKDARRVLSQLEQSRAVLKEAWPWASVDPSRPVTVLALRDADDYRRLVPAALQAGGAPLPAAIFVPAPDRNWIALRTDVTRFEDDDTWDHPYRSALHDYVHVVLHLNFAQLPPWLDEGLSEFWGDTIVDGDHVIIGRVIPSHLWTLRQRTFLPLAKLFSIAPGAPEYSETDRATPFYAGSWAFVHLLTLSETRQPQIAKLMDLLRAGRPAAAAVSEAFGDLAALERDYASYVGRGAFANRRRPALPETKPAVARELSDAEALALRAAFASAAGGAGEAATLAADAIRADPAIAAGHEARALIAWRAQRRDEARQLLERAVQLPGASDFAHALLGQMLWDDAKGGKGSLARVEAEFQRALELNPRFAKMQESLALVREAGGAPADQTVPLALRAAALEPGNVGYRITVIRLMARGGQLQQARVQGEKLLASLSGVERQQAESALTEIQDPKRLPPEVACTGGFGPACHLLGTQYRDGTGVAKDPAKALAYFQKGCDIGHGASCASLGWAYEDGVGVAKDPAKAFTLYRKACEDNDRWACTRLAFALASGAGVEQDVPEAARLLDKSCAAGDAMACAKLGAMLRVGDGVPQDLARADPLLRSACDKGSSWGCGELAGLLVARGSSQDLQEAAKLLEGACEKDDATFCAMLAGLLELGHGVARDTTRAAALYRKACDGGYQPACAKVR